MRDFEQEQDESVGAHVDVCGFRFDNGDLASLMPGDVPRWLDDGTGIESADGYARQQGGEEEEVLGTDNHLANDKVIKIIPRAHRCQRKVGDKRTTL